MDTRERWNDFHFMNSAFRDVAALYAGPARTRWIDAALVRFSFPSARGAGPERSIAQTVRALDGLLVEAVVLFRLSPPPQSSRRFSLPSSCTRVSLSLQHFNL